MGVGTSPGAWVWSPLQECGWRHRYRGVGVDISTGAWVWAPLQERGCRHLYRCVGLSCPESLKKADFSSPCSHQSPLEPQMGEGFLSSSLIHAETLAGLVCLYTTTLTRQADTVSLPLALVLYFLSVSDDLCFGKKTVIQMSHLE